MMLIMNDVMMMKYCDDVSRVQILNTVNFFHLLSGHNCKGKL